MSANVSTSPGDRASGPAMFISLPPMSRQRAFTSQVGRLRQAPTPGVGWPWRGSGGTVGRNLLSDADLVAGCRPHHTVVLGDDLQPLLVEALEQRADPFVDGVGQAEQLVEDLLGDRVV